MSQAPANIGASVRSRLLRLARERRDDFQLVLLRYANERLLYRLACSKHASQFVLKGATLFTLWTGEPHRATRDVDLLGFGPPDERRIRSIFSDLLTLGVESDGLRFELDSLSVGPIREDQAYSGVRVTLIAHLTSAKVRMQVDVGFGDIITPEPAFISLPTLLDFPAPTLRAYPRETVVAEKVEAMVKLSHANSRMKDFYDLQTLGDQFPFDGQLLVRALVATFARRGTPLPSTRPVALTPEFTEHPAKRTQWRAFLRKSGVVSDQDLSQLTAAIARFVEPPLNAAYTGKAFPGHWAPGGPWN